MLRTVAALATAAWLFVTPGEMSAQSTTTTYETAVTFTLPVNLTQLSPDLERVRFICMIQPGQVLIYPPALTQAMGTTTSTTIASWPNRDDLPVVSGKAVGTMRIVYPLATEWFVNPIGQTANYSCGLVGYSTSLQRWEVFSATSPIPAFKLDPVPMFHGTFVW
jgi:hypothetical protein